MTNFKAVSAFNELIGNAKGEATLAQIEKQFDLIASEFEELRKGLTHYIEGCQAIQSGDYCAEEVFGIGGYTEGIREIRDGIADVLVTTYGLAHRMGIDADADMKAVSESNMSKFYRGTQYDAFSVEHALSESLGIKVERRVASAEHVDSCFNRASGQHEPVHVWAFISADDSDPERPRGKLLKAPGYKPPVFS